MQHAMLQLIMFGRKSSLRRKIILGYIASLLIILSIATIIFFNLILIEERLKFSAVITRFVDTVLEIRRYEKNYFLYRQRADLLQTFNYIDTAVKLVEDNRGKFDLVELPERLDLLQKSAASKKAVQILTRYKVLLAKLDNQRSPLPDESIRQLGHDITELAEGLAESEREMIKGMLSEARRSLVISVLLFFAGSVGIALIVSAVVIKPLKDLERSMQSIASGRFEMLQIDSKDKEIISLKEAFDRMIREIFSQRDIIRSEKLSSLGTMLAGIAHEINNPLSNMSTSAEILSEEMESGDLEFKRDLVEQIIHETDRARDIVRSVLEFTRDREFRKERAGLADLLTETMRFIRSDLAPHITMNIDIPAGLTVYVDKQKFQHALLNLLKNAMDAIPDEGREGKITITARGEADSEVEIKISDTGTGIPEKIIDRIFDPFFTTKDVGKGTGLGLFVTHNIIEQHGGSISVSSRVGEGTVFTIKLPAQGGERNG